LGGFRREIARRRTSATGGEYQVAFFPVGQFDENVAYAVDAIWHEPRQRAPGRRHHLTQEFFNCRATGIAVGPGASAIGHGDDADP